MKETARSSESKLWFFLTALFLVAVTHEWLLPAVVTRTSPAAPPKHGEPTVTVSQVTLPNPISSAPGSDELTRKMTEPPPTASSEKKSRNPEGKICRPHTSHRPVSRPKNSHPGNESETIHLAVCLTAQPAEEKTPAATENTVIRSPEMMKEPCLPLINSIVISLTGTDNDRGTFEISQPPSCPLATRKQVIHFAGQVCSLQTLANVSPTRRFCSPTQTRRVSLAAVVRIRRV